MTKCPYDKLTRDARKRRVERKTNMRKTKKRLSVKRGRRRGAAHGSAIRELRALRRIVRRVVRAVDDDWEDFTSTWAKHQTAIVCIQFPMRHIVEAWQALRHRLPNAEVSEAADKKR